MTRPRTKLQKAPPMGGALRASGPEGAEHGSVALMLSQDQTHKCGCRCCTDVVDVGQESAPRRLSTYCSCSHRGSRSKSDAPTGVLAVGLAVAHGE